MTHDQLVMWTQDNLGQILADVFTGWSDQEKETWEKANPGEEMPSFLVTVKRKVWEHAIIPNYGPRSFIDLAVSCTVPTIYEAYEETNREVLADQQPAGRTAHKYWVKEKKWVARCEEQRVTVFFEAKTSIRSAGELFRQLRVYSTFLSGRDRIVVVSPDTRFAGLIREQGFGFYSPAHETVDLFGSLG